MGSPDCDREGRLPGLLPDRHAPHHGTTDLRVLLRQRRPVGAHQSTDVASPFHALKDTTSDRRGPCLSDRSRQQSKNPPEQFTGDVWFDVITSPQDENQRMGVGVIRFASGARTAWHSHANGQTLHVTTQGAARMQARGGDIIEVQAEQTVYTPPGEEHWHGATPDDFMEHIAMYENSDDPNAATDWGQHVTDEEYKHQPALSFIRASR